MAKKNTKTEAIRKIAFVLNSERVRIVATVKPAQKVAPHLTIDLKPIPTDAMELSITGECSGSSGQCADSIRENAAGVPDVLRLCDIWDRWHLNGMKAGTRAQLAAIEQMPAPIVGDHYKAVTAYLDECGLLIDTNTGTVRVPGDPGEGYKYGTAWLFEPVPAEVLTELSAILDRLNGKRLGKAPDVDDAPDVSESDDHIDSRDVEKRIEIYRDAVLAFGVDGATRVDDYDPESNLENGDEIYLLLEELNALTDLERQIGTNSYRMVRDSYFEEYAREFAKDCGMIQDDAKWPGNCIDWEEAADELKRDWTSVTFKGVEYWAQEM
ncbi:MAG TPA: hypothetical protein VK629_05710 [Steroidobacteraceae bacterium]|nr:hypothetical protein [Steroidobacteraceae bacterium]